MITYSFIYLLYTFILTYLILGLIISFETTAAMSGGKYAVVWIKEHFTYEEFYFSMILFYPLLILSYFFLEILPSFITHEIRCEFNMDCLFQDLFNTK